ncbi:hypothetical protein Clacol_005113 [Clathrus columnatus]|uniref:Uncharacterized protein n=1 Tax=Clathrus columnatus TaxID=1419009 RepID=A0AAV5AG21_9AGAM|nr:hypothetical protein Clacol_005113 [Clathrus columnatus]
MATIQDRNFSRTYAGLKNQFAVAGVLAAICLVGYELMRRQRRGRGRRMSQKELGNVETWEKPSPALPIFPLRWIIQALSFPESSLPNLIGVDASVYVRFLRGCRLFVFLHTITTFPIVFAVHIVFSSSEIPLNTMDKASISSLVPSHQRLLFIHVILAYWIAITWVTNLYWIARDTFRFRAQTIQSLTQRYSSSDDSVPSLDDLKNRGLRLRTVMVTNIPVPLRSEKDLKEYFEYYMSRPLAEPPIAFGFFTRLATLLYHRIISSSTVKRFKAIPDDAMNHHYREDQNGSVPTIEQVVIARKTTELASLLERHDTVLKDLEYAHICLAKNVLQAIRDYHEAPDQQLTEEEKELLSALSPFVERFRVPSSQPGYTIITPLRRVKDLLFRSVKSDENETTDDSGTDKLPDQTIWEILHSLPRTYLDQYQPLTSLRRLFRGKSVPAIDYYTTRLAYLTALIHDDKSRPIEDYHATSTAFVTFSNIGDARRAVKYLQTHPSNPLACLVVPAPDIRDLDWPRIMKSSFTGEFIKDWVIELGVWAFTLSWIIPLLHVYSRTYENNGKIILIRLVRFSLDGLILAHVVFLAFLVVLKETAEATFIGILLVLTVVTKLSLTRICRMKFGKGDEAEEAIFNRLHGQEESPVSKHETHQDTQQVDKSGNNNDLPVQSIIAKTLSHSPTTSEIPHLKTWKEFPNGFNFSYASYPPRRQVDLHRPVNPFQVKEELDTQLSGEGHENNVTKRLMTEPERMDNLASLSNHRQPAQIVTSHPPFQNWDDSPDLDRSYENPFYCASVENVLWLPRNPFGNLDLDDTVDLHVSLTSEGQSENLNRWLDQDKGEEEGVVIPLTQSPRVSLASSLSAPLPLRTDSGLSRGSRLFGPPERQYTGMEDISMSSVLTARVSALENSNRDRGNLAVVKRKFSADHRSELQQTISLDANVIPRRPRLHSRTYAEPAHEPDVQAESTVLREPIQLVSSPSEEGTGTRSVIPLNEAVLSEVVAEEKHHALQRIQREAMEKKMQEKYRPSWWRWFFWYNGDSHRTRTETA